MAEFIVKTAQQKHAIWQSYDALTEARCVWPDGALLERNWLFLVREEATKPILFRVDC